MKNGFTQAEVLITLGIVGIVAAMTLPQLIKNYQGAVLHSQLQKSYSVLTQALQKMSYEEQQTVNQVNYGSGRFAPIFFNYFKTFVNCGSTSCEFFPNHGNSSVDSDQWLVSKTYKTYSRKDNLKSAFLDDGQLITSDGMFLMIENLGANNIFITVDVNGKNKRPNAWGHDLFTFQLMQSGKLLPMGAAGTNYTNLNKYCSATSSDKQNGIACTEKALTDLSYFKNLP